MLTSVTNRTDTDFPQVKKGETRKAQTITYNNKTLAHVDNETGTWETFPHKTFGFHWWLSNHQNHNNITIFNLNGTYRGTFCLPNPKRVLPMIVTEFTSTVTNNSSADFLEVKKNQTTSAILVTYGKKTLARAGPAGWVYHPHPLFAAKWRTDNKSSHITITDLN